ncbi:hypothetical protein [Methylomagnum sp.]
MKLTNFTHKDSAKRAIIAANQAAGRGLQVGRVDIKEFETTATLSVTWRPEAKYVHDGGLPYYATFEVIVDEKEDGCADTANWWAETLELEIPIYVTMGELPSQEKKSLTFSGGFTVRNDVTFTVKPEFEIGARIQHAKLQEANLLVNADIDFMQQLTIQASGAATLDQTLELLPPRKFVKVFTAGPVPVVVSGEFAINRCEAWSNAKRASRVVPGSPSAGRIPGGNLQGPRPGVEPFVEPRPDPLVGSGRVNAGRLGPPKAITARGEGDSGREARIALSERGAHQIYRMGAAQRNPSLGCRWPDESRATGHDGFRHRSTHPMNQEASP